MRCGDIQNIVIKEMGDKICVDTKDMGRYEIWKDTRCDELRDIVRQKE